MYPFKEIEKKWRTVWQEMNLYATGRDKDKPKFYCLDFFPYPSGDGLSVGHCRNYIPSDVVTRLKRMQGYNVLHPMGWDGFGLPAENYALKMKMHPAKTTAQNAANYKRQFNLIEASYDWTKEINSTDPAYYRWTQWFFLLLFKRGLAYQAMGSQWWCPSCKTILANEQVEAGKCWRCNSDVTRKALKQWYFKITDYADRLINDLDNVDWPESIKMMQCNWIGRSEGTEIIFKTVDTGGNKHNIPIFTTRVDTIYGATFMTLAPEHPLVEKLTTSEQKNKVEAYVEKSRRESEIERLSTEKEKTGIFTGSYAENPFNKDKIPIWIGDYVLLSYGTGAVMAVPAHDKRDFAFAKKYNIPIKEVISPDGKEHVLGDAYVEYGIMINSDQFNGLSSEEGLEKLSEFAKEHGFGGKKISYRFRDWLISRQRYWGAPIPIVQCKKCGIVPVPENELPVLLPEIEDFQPTGTGRSPLAKADDFVNTKCPKCGGPAQRETDTMDGFACSSWYFLRFPNPDSSRAPFDKEKVKYWLPVDLYVGGAEHAVMHLLYARFWTKVMYDEGLIEFDEPFKVLKNQGMMLSYDNQKMSKSKGNVITPDSVAEEFGTDALRAYILFMGPFDQEVKWEQRGIKGVSRFLNRVWDIVLEAQRHKGTEAQRRDNKKDKTLNMWIHKTIKRFTADIERLQFNTAVAALMEYINYLYEIKKDKEVTSSKLWTWALETLLRLLSPITPFLSEELWHVMGHQNSIHKQKWPEYNEGAIKVDEIEIVVQINGKIKSRMQISTNLSEEEIKKLALDNQCIKEIIANKTIRKIFVVPGKLVNIVIQT
ncbi:MAG: leucine--tRNA ligase [bacterium]|nr:leucine--tRNA ligase [bacterium]